MNLSPKGMDRADPLEGRHGAAQPVGLRGREAGADDRDLHRLLLEQRHAERLLEHALERLGRIGHRLQAAAPAQIRMHHVALDRPRAHDRDLDHEVVEAPRLEARQHGHLRPALDLEHADAVRPAQHVVDRGILGRHGGEVELSAVVPREQVERLADAGQHAERQHVDLEDAERVQIVLVPLDDGALGHRGVDHRHHLVEPAPGQHEAADVLREVAREADQLARELAAPGAGAARSGRGRARARGAASRPPSLQPQMPEASAPTASSDRPSALPTSRIALRAR